MENVSSVEMSRDQLAVAGPARHYSIRRTVQCITDRPSSQFVVASRTDLLVVTTSQTYTIRYDRHACDIDHC